VAGVWAGPLSGWYARGGAGGGGGVGGAGGAARLRSGVEAWRADLRASVGAVIAEQLVWDEGAAVAGWWELGDAGWTALRLFAVYAERPEVEMPDVVPAVPELDRVWREAADAKFARSVYGQVVACSVWLPGDFPATLRVPMPDGEVAEVGSVVVLGQQLKWLNARTFAADEVAVAAWGGLPAVVGGSGFLDAARRGFAGLWAAAGVGVREGVPVVVGA